MELAKIEVRGTCAKVIYSRDIPKGIVGATITIKYLDPMWDNLVKTVVFRGCVTRDVIDDGKVVTIPHEVVERSSTPLIVGISGADAGNNLVIPTFWADLGIVQDAADPSGDPSADPSLPIWAVLRAELDRLKNSGATDEQIAAAVAAYLEENPVGTGTVRTVNDTEPDENGNVSINIPTDYVKTVNGTAPDKNGNVDITIPDSGGNVDLTGYATEQYVQEYAQPKGEYLTEVPEDYAKTEDIPTKPEDIGAQPAGNYLTEVPSGYATEEFVKNKIAEAELGGEEVDMSGYAQKSELPTKVSELENDAGYLTEHQDISGKLDASALPTAINTALAQAKASGEFDGQPGKDGKDGKDGYTPVKGVDYFDGKDGRDGYTPQKNVDYFDGKDGKNGENGEDGYTPVRGTDYWTDADKAEIKSYVDEAILGGAW